MRWKPPCISSVSTVDGLIDEVPRFSILALCWESTLKASLYVAYVAIVEEDMLGYAQRGSRSDPVPATLWSSFYLARAALDECRTQLSQGQGPLMVDHHWLKL